MIKFSKDKILLLHQIMGQATGGTVGVRDEGLLESALESAFSSFDGEDFYPTKEEKGARLGYALISNHAFLDGNKRIGVYELSTGIDHMINISMGIPTSLLNAYKFSSLGRDLPFSIIYIYMDYIRKKIRLLPFQPPRIHLQPGSLSFIHFSYLLEDSSHLAVLTDHIPVNPALPPLFDFCTREQPLR